MSGKKISFAKPAAAPQANADSWVKTRDMDKQGTKRITFDVSEDLHRRLKSQCAMQGKKMREVIERLIEDALARGEAGKS